MCLHNPLCSFDDYVKHANSTHDNRTPKGSDTLGFQPHLVIPIAKYFGLIVITSEGYLEVPPVRRFAPGLSVQFAPGLSVQFAPGLSRPIRSRA